MSRYSGIALISDTSGSLPAERDRTVYGRGTACRAPTNDVARLASERF